MKANLGQDHPFYTLLFEGMQETIQRHLTSAGDPSTTHYLTGLLVAGLHEDSIFSLRSRSGRRIISFSEMLAEGDIRLRADSFERERQVHQHIGDFILFWSGLCPNYLTKYRMEAAGAMILDLPSQARESYNLVGTYELQRQTPDAQIFLKLSRFFDDYAFCLRDVGTRLHLVPWASA